MLGQGFLAHLRVRRHPDVTVLPFGAPHEERGRYPVFPGFVHFIVICETLVFRPVNQGHVLGVTGGACRSSLIDGDFLVASVWPGRLEPEFVEYQVRGVFVEFLPCEEADRDQYGVALVEGLGRWDCSGAFRGRLMSPWS